MASKNGTLPPGTRRPRYQRVADDLTTRIGNGKETQLSILATKEVAADAALAEMLECREGARWLQVNSLRAVHGDVRPVCMTTAYIDLRFPDLEKNLEKLSGPISAMLERVYAIRIARIEQSIQAVRLGKRQAKLLRALDGSPALRAIRRYYDNTGRLIELSKAIHPGERFTYVTSLVRS
jgi:DNA-binding GntR family transcriptional regulator